MPACSPLACIRADSTASYQRACQTGHHTCTGRRFAAGPAAATGFLVAGAGLLPAAAAGLGAAAATAGAAAPVWRYVVQSPHAPSVFVVVLPVHATLVACHTRSIRVSACQEAESRHGAGCSCCAGTSCWQSKAGVTHQYTRGQLSNLVYHLRFEFIHTGQLAAEPPLLR